MKNKNHLIILIAIILASFSSLGCDDELSEEENKARLEEMKEEILVMISDLRCNDSTDCNYIGFGSKPCGGFWRYLVYSSSNVDTVLLKEKVKGYNDFNKTLNEKYGWISDCSLPPIPNLKNVEGVCINANDL